MIEREREANPCDVLEAHKELFSKNQLCQVLMKDKVKMDGGFGNIETIDDLDKSTLGSM